MKYKQFAKVIKYLKESSKLLEDTYNIIRPEVFEKHNQLITLLLEEIYGEFVVCFIIDEWLRGNKSPIVFNSDDGTRIEKSINTLQDLWKISEELKEPGKELKKEIQSPRVFEEILEK